MENLRRRRTGHVYPRKSVIINCQFRAIFSVPGHLVHCSIEQNLEQPLFWLEIFLSSVNFPKGQTKNFQQIFGQHFFLLKFV
jgi:hypothetical protein